ncbi:sigma factor-like helix-turn-helix DNA-binding protein [Brevibacillus laterosporus]|uniref:sigma factor-like helix-turn-helix DNA-binding protein n=1 Tax=Brevibacillus laterosporus TaxID=1465 RepID=UPI003D1CCBD2
MIKAQSTGDQKEEKQLENALCYLSPREKECFILTHGEGFSFEETARFLCISRSSVQAYPTRNRLETTRFAILFFVALPVLNQTLLFRNHNVYY